MVINLKLYNMPPPVQEATKELVLAVSPYIRFLKDAPACGTNWPVCQDAFTALAAALGPNYNFVCGTVEGQRHVWLKRGAIHLDVCAGQFQSLFNEIQYIDDPLNPSDLFGIGFVQGDDARMRSIGYTPLPSSDCLPKVIDEAERMDGGVYGDWRILPGWGRGGPGPVLQQPAITVGDNSEPDWNAMDMDPTDIPLDPNEPSPTPAPPPGTTPAPPPGNTPAPPPGTTPAPPPGAPGACCPGAGAGEPFQATINPWGTWPGPDPACTAAEPVICNADPEKFCYQTCQQNVRNQNETCRRLMKSFTIWMKANGCKGSSCKYRNRSLKCRGKSARSSCGYGGSYSSGCSYCG